VTTLRAGDLVYVTRAAGVQFTRPVTFRLIRVLDWPTYDGWVWRDGYQPDATGDAVTRRSIFVQPAGSLVRRRPDPAPAGPARAAARA
jgi:hypothetical protein